MQVILLQLVSKNDLKDKKQKLVIYLFRRSKCEAHISLNIVIFSNFRGLIKKHIEITTI